MSRFSWRRVRVSLRGLTPSISRCSSVKRGQPVLQQGADG